MTSLNNLRKELAKERRKHRETREMERLTKELNSLRTKSKSKGIFTTFQKQRKTGKGIGGWLQRVADNQ